ncbi:hypothetical protein POF50_009575 [Streptomyces sp. SL13]|uniref:Uncharacterized protein n=1 Tax=Streptantibioticus silvisoli TaxID=2705255 RepID=A0AA90KFQ6_9ACTN|nr:hypothetical protein [Streptantibioticus silvisoli]MDI5969585.1 hypothetical protein [Streptantibioticus silvisoli]
MVLDPGPGFRALIRPYTGEVTRIAPPGEQGFGTDLLAVIDSRQGRFFVKAMRNRPGGRRDQMVRER